MRPERNASATISARERTSKTAAIFSRRSLIVCALRWTSAPISLLVRPPARRRREWRRCWGTPAPRCCAPFTPGSCARARDGRRSSPAPAQETWCRRGDSNPHGLPHTPLKRARLPVPPLRPGNSGEVYPRQYDFREVRLTSAAQRGLASWRPEPQGALGTNERGGQPDRKSVV